MIKRKTRRQINSISVILPVFRDAIRACEATRSIISQSLPSDTELDVILVDDGSDDGSTELLRRMQGGNVRLVELKKNQGRSSARNAGAAASSADLLVFMDCDCIPLNEHFIEGHLSAFDESTAATSGHVQGMSDDSFWDRYQKEASSRREQQHSKGIIYSGSSQNIAVDRNFFLKCGGFSKRYQKYGFEDRDFLIRISRLGNVRWANRAIVKHMDALTLAAVSRKMTEAGEFSSALFSKDHPDAYRALGYSRLDVKIHKSLIPLAATADTLCSPLSRLGDVVLRTGLAPFACMRLYVRLISAASYLAGTARRDAGTSI